MAPALRGCRLDAQWGAAGEYWRIAGFTDAIGRQEYELLCGVGGTFLEQVYSSNVEGERVLLEERDPKVRWYRLLKATSPAFGDLSYGEQLHEDGTSAGFIFTGSLDRIAEASANTCLALHASHPLVERKSKWTWLHENYVKAIVIGVVVAIVGTIIKLVSGV
jgi:hypothetical protein